MSAEPTHDLTVLADPVVGAVHGPTPEVMAAERDARDRETWAKYDIRPTRHFDGTRMVDDWPVPDVPEDEQRQLAERIAGHGALSDAVAAFRRWLYLPDPGGLLVALAAYAANLAPGDPLWLLLVGPPGGGKTELLQPLASLPDVHATATLTEAALLSGTPKRDQAADAKGGLLRAVGDFGILLCKDFGSVLSMNRDARAAVLAALREVYDGAWTRHVGTDGGRTLTWSGKVGMLAAVTPAIDSHHAVIGSMGERFVMYRLPSADPDTQARRALAHVGHERDMRRELGDVVAAVVAGVDRERLITPADDATAERLVQLATLAVRCRSAVERDGYTREVQLIPEPEAPARLALVLLRLFDALGAIGTDDETAWRLVTKSALDSMPALRRRVLEDLTAHQSATSTGELAERLDYPTNTVRRALEDLTAHAVVERQRGGTGRPDLWQPTAWTRDRWPTLPEMSGAANVGAATVPEMSGEAPAERGNERGTVSISPPLRVYDDISGTPSVALDDDGLGPITEYVDCRDYGSHQTAYHRRVAGGGWRCDACAAGVPV